MPDLSNPPDFVFDSTPQYSTLISTFENGVEQRRPRRNNSLTEFRLTYKNRPKSEMDAINALFESKLGAFGSFTWLNPEDGQTYTVRFKEDSFTSSLKMYNLYDFEFVLKIIL